MGIFGVFAVLSAAALPKQEKTEGESEFHLYKSDIFFWLSAILAQLSFGAFYAFFTVFETEHGMSVSDVTLLWSIGVVAEIVMFLFQGTLLKKLDPLFIMKLSVAILAARWLVLDIFPGNFAATFAAQLTHALTFALYTTAAFVFIFSRYRNKTMAQMQFYGLSYGLGGFFGSLLAGSLYGENLFLYSAIFASGYHHTLKLVRDGDRYFIFRKLEFSHYASCTVAFRDHVDIPPIPLIPLLALHLLNHATQPASTGIPPSSAGR